MIFWIPTIRGQLEALKSEEELGQGSCYKKDWALGELEMGY